MATKKTFNTLVKENPQLAAGYLLNAGIHVVNNLIPDIYLSKDEYKTLVGHILAGTYIDPDAEESSDSSSEDSDSDAQEDVD